MVDKRHKGKPLPVLNSAPAPVHPSASSCGSGQRRHYARHAHVFEEGAQPDTYAYVVSGRVKLVSAPSPGRETIIGFVEPGELICGNVVFARETYCCTAVAATPETEVLHLPRSELEGHGALLDAPIRRLLEEVTQRGMVLCQRVSEVAGGRVQRKVAMVLLRLADKLRGEAQATEVRLPATLTRKDIAELCGTTVETTIRVIKELERGCQLRLEGRTIVVNTVAMRRWIGQT